MELAWAISPPSTQLTEQETRENEQIRAVNAQIARLMNTPLPRQGGKRRTRRRRTTRRA